jgi:hypothetical protein
MELLPQGRADLKEFIVHAQEARQAAQNDPGTTTAAERMGLVA